MCEPRIYVACLSSYNAGTLHGAWIDLSWDHDPDSVHEEIEKMLSKSKYYPAEEWAIHDYEGFGGYRLHEYESIDDVCEVAEFIAEVDDDEIAGELLSRCDDVDSARECWKENYRGCFDSLEDYAEDFIDQTVPSESIPEAVRYYIDFASMARDWESGGDIFSFRTNSGVQVFWNC